MNAHDIYEFETTRRPTRGVRPARRRRTDRQLLIRRELIDMSWTYGLGISLVCAVFAAGALA